MTLAPCIMLAICWIIGVATPVCFWPHLQLFNVYFLLVWLQCGFAITRWALDGWCPTTWSRLNHLYSSVGKYKHCCCLLEVIRIQLVNAKNNRLIHLGLQAYDEVQINRVPVPKICMRRMVPYNLEQTINHLFSRKMLIILLMSS